MSPGRWLSPYRSATPPVYRLAGRDIGEVLAATYHHKSANRELV
jgi:hypothetical protein